MLLLVGRAVPLAACAAGGVWRARSARCDDDFDGAGPMMARPSRFRRRLTVSTGQSAEAQIFKPTLPYPQWDSNWDHRELDAYGRPRAFRRGGSTARRRHVLLIRHGQYCEESADDAERVLTALGRAQAERTGARVAELVQQPGAVCRAVHSSTMARAVETADIILARMPERTRRAAGDPALCEGIPCHAIPGGPHHSAAVYRDGARVESAPRAASGLYTTSDRFGDTPTRMREEDRTRAQNGHARGDTHTPWLS